MRRLSPAARLASVLLHTLLILLTLWQAGQLLVVLTALPLLAALPGILRGRERTYGWASMLVAFYCALWLAEGYARPATQTLAFAMAGVAALDFSALVLFARWTKRERTASAPPAPAPGSDGA